MSFDYNPFKHVELIQCDDEPNLWFWHCHSCGADSYRESRSDGLRVPLNRTGDLITDFHRHIRRSHEFTPELLEARGWSKW